jgi:hypothetical protein
MANTPANAGSSGEQAPPSAAAPLRHAAALPPDTMPPRAPARSAPMPRPDVRPAPTARPARPAPAPRARAGAGHRAARSKDPAPATSTSPAEPNALAWVLYLIVLAGVAAGLFIACQGSQSAGRGTGVVGCSLLAAGLARLVLPPRYAGLLSSRRKASDVLAFAALGAGVLTVALMLP